MDKETTKIWYNFLRLAQRMGLQVDWNIYKTWGTADEIRATKFETWWRRTGRDLYPLPVMSVVEDKGAYVIVRVPKDMSRYTMRNAIAKVMKKPYRRGLDGAHVGRRITTGLVRQEELRHYLRLLELDVRAGRKQLPMKDLLRQLEERQGRNAGRVSKSNATIRAKAGSRKRIRLFKVPKFEVPTERVGRLWLKKGERVVKNVAAGVFPGKAYRNP